MALGPRISSSPVSMSLAGVLLVCVALTSCGGDSPTEPPAPTTLTLSSTTVSLTFIGATQEVSATVLDQRGAPMPAVVVTWESSVPQVATVSSSGLVTAVGVGSGLITARAGSVSATASLTVQQVAATVALTPATVSLTALGSTQQLTATVRDQGGTAVPGAAVTWSSSAPDIATVSSAGLVTAIKTGTAAVNATSGAVSSSASVVVQQTASKVRLSPSSSAAQVGQTRSFQAQILDARDNLMTGSVVWSTSDAAIAVIDASGTAQGVSPGTATVKATAGSLSGEATLVVTDTVKPSASVASPVDGVTLSEVVTVRVDATDNHAVASLVLLVDGKATDTLKVRPWEFRWRTRLVANGTHSLQVRAADPSGNEVTSKAVSVTTANPTVVRVVNYLATQINVDINDSDGWVASDSYYDFSILLGAGASLSLSWEAVKPALSDGTAVGERFAGVFDSWTPVPADSLVRYYVDNELTESTYYFAMVTNRSAAYLMPVVNRGTGAEYRCPCSVPPGMVRGMIGYYRLYSWSTVAVYDWAKGYSGPYLSFPVGATDLADLSGNVEFPFNASPSPPRIATPDPQDPPGRTLVDRFLEVPLRPYAAGRPSPIGRANRTGVETGPKPPGSVRPFSSMRGIRPPPPS